jgi:hypothetical protein
MALLPRPRQTFVERIEPALVERSALRLEEDFSSGLSGWDGGPQWASEWAYDPAGLVRPRKLALLTDSLPLSDYQLEFVGQIEKKSLCWVFRASDLRNYYAMKITITKPGPLPLGAIVRSVVVNGATVESVQLPLPLAIRNDTLYHVTTTAYHDQFTTSVNGQIVDAFRDRRHPSGGVGLFSGPGEAARVLRVLVTHQDDWLGRICAYLFRDSADSKAADGVTVVDQRKGN